jgi:hypothetical protein
MHLITCRPESCSPLILNADIYHVKALEILDISHENAETLLRKGVKRFIYIVVDTCDQACNMSLQLREDLKPKL